MAAPTKAAQPASMPPPLPAPPPVPVSGITPQRKAIAPTLTEEPKGMTPEKAFVERQRAAIAKATGEGQKQTDAAAGEDAAPPPKPKANTAATPSVSANGKSSVSKSPADVSGDGKPAKAKDDAKADESKSAASEPAAAEPSYDLQSLKKWAEREPEAAAAILGKLGHLPADPNGEWIKLQNKRRKVREEIQGMHEKTMAEAKAERQAAEEARQAMDGAAGKLAPIADLWEAVAEKIAADPQNPQIDFEAADAAFQENAKISIDDYMRLRARRAIGSGSDAVKLRVENQRLRRELAGKPSEATKTKAADSPAEKEDAGTAEPAAKAKPKGEKDWSSELPGKHKLRQLDGWNELLDAEMRKHYDPDTKDYDADPEAMADKILKRELARMSEDDPEEEPATKPKPKAKPASNGKPKDGIPSAAELTPKARTVKVEAAADDEEDNVKIGGMTFAQRQARALRRHQMRMRGELE